MSVFGHVYLMFTSAQQGNLEMFNALRQMGYDFSSNQSELLRSAARNGHYRIVSRLLKDPRINPAALNNDALRSAIAYKHKKIAKRLLELPSVCAAASSDELREWDAEVNPRKRKRKQDPKAEE